MRDLHMHTVYSDGKNTPEEMILEAIARGLDCVGISDHSHAVSDECGMTPEGTLAYRAEMARLKEKYAGQIRVLCGLERDIWSDDTLDYDYVIGSVHTIRMPDGHYVCVDWTPEHLKEKVEQYFGGDWYAMTEQYFATVARVAEVTKCDIIGHFDLVTKFNEGYCLFDERDPRYVRAWQAAADVLLKTGKPFEVNTGAISRGYRTQPYPAPEIRKYILERGGELLMSSDAHSKDRIAFQFEKWEASLTGR
ncbi:MAG: histidinol-phosphatase [Clostridiales bacterium]|nr:histidinol-phosphatase [Clostridiales bacterium]